MPRRVVPTLAAKLAAAASPIPAVLRVRAVWLKELEHISRGLSTSGCTAHPIPACASSAAGCVEEVCRR